MDERPSVCLNMIVKNESGIIKRCLDAARPYFDTWVIVDTGSTDGTQDLIRELLADVPGELHELPWKNFGETRTEALELARGKAERILFLDADDVLIVDPDADPLTSECDAYFTLIEVSNAVTFLRVNLTRTDQPWWWEGPVHETLGCRTPANIGTLKGWTIRSLPDGARSRSVNKWAGDAAILQAAVDKDPTNTRSVFYLAQSYRDAGEIGKSLRWYSERVALGGWDEEVWYSMYQMGMIHEWLGDWNRAMPMYLRAFQYRPTRAEPLVQLSQHYRMEHDYNVALMFSTKAVEIKKPGDVLFLDNNTYDWRTADEYAISLYWVGRFEDARKVNEQILASGKLPTEQVSRIVDNLKFCTDQLAT